MACQTHCCVLTRGEFFISEWAGSCNGLSELECDQQKAFKKLGNVSSCIVEIDSEVIGMENKYNPLSDTCARTSTRAVRLQISLSCASKENLLRALYSEEQEPDSGSHVEDYCIDSLSECDFFPFSKYLVDPESLTVYLRDAMGEVEGTLVLGTDYKYSKSGIEILRDDIVIGDAVILRLAYDYNNANYHEISFLKKIHGYRTLFFKGTNYDSSEGALFDAIFNKVLFAPISQFDLISGDDFLTLNLTGVAERDGDSWFKITKQED